ncbi:hypothetical protein [Candidatus Vidania fulgoroideorum]
MLIYKIINVRRTSFVRAGGRKYQFAVITICKRDDIYFIQKGKSHSLNKAIEKSKIVPASMQKCFYSTREDIPIIFRSSYGKTSVVLCPALNNRLTAGGICKVILDFVGIKRGICKNIGTRNVSNVAEIIKRYFHILYEYR